MKTKSQIKEYIAEMTAKADYHIMQGNNEKDEEKKENLYRIADEALGAAKALEWVLED